MDIQFHYFSLISIRECKGEGRRASRPSQIRNFRLTALPLGAAGGSGAPSGTNRQHSLLSLVSEATTITTTGATTTTLTHLPSPVVVAVVAVAVAERRKQR